MDIEQKYWEFSRDLIEIASPSAEAAASWPAIIATAISGGFRTILDNHFTFGLPSVGGLKKKGSKK